jgi:hypothetical protein
VFIPLSRLHFLEEVPEQFTGGLDNAKRSAKLMRDHRYEIALKLAEFLFPFEGFKQFDLGPFSLGDVLAEGKDVRGIVEFDAFGGEQNGQGLAAAIPPADLPLANGTHRAYVVQGRLPFREVLPQTELGRRAPEHFVVLSSQPV